MAKIIPIIVCGGSGERLIPFLRKGLPKQFLSIVRGSGSLLQTTLSRFKKTSLFTKPILVTNFSYRESIMKSLEEISFRSQAIVWEPEGKNTGPAIAALVSYLQALQLDPNTIISVIPIDHYLEDHKAFIRTLEQVKEFLEKNPNKIVTLSVEQTDFEKNYGHLKLGQTLDQDKKYYLVSDFIEKPQVEVQGTNIFWNSGIYSMSIKTCINLLQKQVPYLLDSCQKAVKEGLEVVGHSPLVERELLLNNEHFAKNSKVSWDQILTLPYQANSLVSTDIGTKWEDIGLWSGIERVEKSNAKTSFINRDLFLNYNFDLQK
jgi:mannose-1-phosphate guanylyltransferase/mannose-6-phosphate isomerase